VANSVNYQWSEGEDELKRWVDAGHLAVVMLDVGATHGEGFNPVGAHWTVIYAYDQDGVYLSNWPRDGKCTWDNLRRSWNTLLTRSFYGNPPWKRTQWFLVPWTQPR
jgi:hypothetical protein